MPPPTQAIQLKLPFLRRTLRTVSTLPSTSRPTAISSSSPTTYPSLSNPEPTKSCASSLFFPVGRVTFHPLVHQSSSQYISNIKELARRSQLSPGLRRRPSESPKLAATGTYMPALASCGRIDITNPGTNWQMELMPVACVMGDMLLLPNAEVPLINGASKGSARFGLANNPVLEPVIYHHTFRSTERFRTLEANEIPRCTSQLVQCCQTEAIWQQEAIRMADATSLLYHTLQN